MSFKKKETMLAVFLDIKKAYDSVNRKKLFNKLAKLGIKDKMYKWFKTFLLTDRTARVRVNNTLSNSQTFKYGVPQGSPLSPLLFNIYVRKVTDKNVQKYLNLQTT